MNAVYVMAQVLCMNVAVIAILKALVTAAEPLKIVPVYVVVMHYMIVLVFVTDLL